ncbi:MAG: 3-oxoacyl-ACP reductase FabG [Betaproteobacteria bacterium]
MKRALVTGGSGGLGAAICRRLARDGHHVAVHAHSREPEAHAIVAAIRADGGSAEPIVFDVTDGAAVQRAAASLLKDGPVQVLVNNAGVHDDAPLAGMRFAQWSRVIDVTLNGFFHVTQALLLEMMATRWGRIVNVASVSAQIGNPGQTNYAAAKAGLIGATRSLALEVAKRGITVNAIAPGLIDTGMAGDRFPPERVRELVPVGRMGEPDEVAALVAYLVSDAAGYVSGQVLSINGAMV